MGRLIAALRELGEFDNTLIVFFSDNGAAGEDVSRLADNETFLPERFDLSYETMGRLNSFVYYGPEWASAASGSYRHFKQFVHEGGIRVPGFAVVPPSLAERLPGATTGAFVHVTDLFPTFLELAGAEAPAAEDKILPIGKSLVPLLRGELEDGACRTHRRLGNLRPAGDPQGSVEGLLAGSAPREGRLGALQPGRGPARADGPSPTSARKCLPISSPPGTTTWRRTGSSWWRRIGRSAHPCRSAERTGPPRVAGDPVPVHFAEQIEGLVPDLQYGP